MKYKIILSVILIFSLFQSNNAQEESDLLSHYKSYYAQMLKQDDAQGIINAMTHLLILEPNVKRSDTLALRYMNDGKYFQALNLIGIDTNDNDTNMTVEVKAICLKALNQPARALEHYELLFKRIPSASLAYELADLKIQLNDLIGANLNITYGIANCSSNMMKPFYETQQPYQVPLKAAFLYLKAIAKYSEDPESNHDSSTALLDESLALAPEFNLAILAKNAISSKKAELENE